VFGCGQSQPCSTHRKSRGLDSRERKGTTTERWYGWSWQQRSAAFRRQYPYCGDRPGGREPVMSRCYTEGIVTEANQVDHVIPHRKNRALFDDRDGNWQSLCASCGARKSAAGL
jgi:5-methylcytosine-specific restriction enzyme A